MDILLEDQSHSFLYLTFRRTSLSLYYKKALHKSKRKFIYSLALIQHCLKIHLRHLIFDCDRLMGILAAYLVFPGSPTEWSKMIGKQSVCLYIIISVLHWNELLEVWFNVSSFSFMEGHFREAFCVRVSWFLKWLHIELTII